MHFISFLLAVGLLSLTGQITALPVEVSSLDETFGHAIAKVDDYGNYYRVRRDGFLNAIPGIIKRKEETNKVCKGRQAANCAPGDSRCCVSTNDGYDNDHDGVIDEADEQERKSDKKEKEQEEAARKKNNNNYYNTNTNTNTNTHTSNGSKKTHYIKRGNNNIISRDSTESNALHQFPTRKEETNKKCYGKKPANCAPGDSRCCVSTNDGYDGDHDGRIDEADEQERKSDKKEKEQAEAAYKKQHKNHNTYTG